MLKSIASLVHRRGSVYWFRKSVPVDLIDRLGSSDIRRSLRTCNARVARQRAWALILVVEEAFAILRNAGLTPGVRDALSAVLDNVMDDLDRSGQQWSQRLRYRALLDSLVGAEPAAAGEISAPPATVITASEPHPVSRGPEPQRQPFKSLTSQSSGEIAQAVIEAINLGKTHPDAAMPLTFFLPKHIAALRKAGRGEQYLSEVGTKMRIFACTVGDKPVHEYNKGDLLGYRDLIDQMPHDAIKHLKTDDPVRAIALNQRRAVPLPSISSTTVNSKYLTIVRGFFGYLVERGIAHQQSR
ncbi:DUF6538 domain-containing protein [Devosia sp. 919]|uniref:DUF6538 domain-containing protein n=1 Tax=Devosia sp. 919 TaxID=2726065 RepID=UPI00155320F0|nr:DUF6538 domain-containing protein [Devosia sp. 919]